MRSGVLRGLFFVVIFTALAPILSVNSRRYCRDCPRQWYSTSILQGFEGFEAEVTSDPDPSYFCQRYVKTYLSEDGKTAQYDYSYRNAGCNSTTRYDNKTFVAASNRVLLVYSGSDPAVDRLTILHLDRHNCFVVHANETNEVYLLDNIYTGYKRAHSCFRKLLEYAGDNITFLRDQYICKD